MTCFEADAGKRGVASDSPPARLITRFQRKTQGRRCARSSSSLGQWPAGPGPRLRWAVLRAHSETRRPLWPLPSSQMMALWLASTNLLSTPIVPLIDYIPAQSVNCLGVEISLGLEAIDVPRSALGPLHTVHDRISLAILLLQTPSCYCSTWREHHTVSEPHTVFNPLCVGLLLACTRPRAGESSSDVRQGLETGAISLAPRSLCTTPICLATSLLASVNPLRSRCMQKMRQPGCPHAPQPALVAYWYSINITMDHCISTLGLSSRDSRY